MVMGCELFSKRKVESWRKVAIYQWCHLERQRKIYVLARSVTMQRSFADAQDDCTLKLQAGITGDKELVAVATPQTRGGVDIFRGPGFSRGPETRLAGSTFAGVI